MIERKAGYVTRKYYDPLDDVLDRPIAFNPAFKKITGSTVAALMLSQAFYWSKRTSDNDGWFYKTVEEWEDETGLTRSEQETARKHLKPFMETDLRGVPARLYYRILKDEIADAMGVQFAETPRTSLPEPREQVGDIPANINRNTETTTETIAKPKKSLPTNSGMDWMVAAGVSAVDMAATNDKIAREAEVANLYESAMGYNPLNWQDKDMPELLRFLMTKTPEEVKAFAKWSRKEYSTFPPTKARQFPLRVKEFWPLAFADQTNKPYQPEESWL